MFLLFPQTGFPPVQRERKGVSRGREGGGGSIYFSIFDLINRQPNYLPIVPLGWLSTCVTMAALDLPSTACYEVHENIHVDTSGTFDVRGNSKKNHVRLLTMLLFDLERQRGSYILVSLLIYDMF